MIHSIHLKNFKPFKNIKLPLKKLTLIAGLNSAGKSSFIQSLALLRQSYQQGYLTQKGLLLNGDIVEIGTAQDALFEGATEDLIEFEVTWENQIEGNWCFDYDSPESRVMSTSQNSRTNSETVYKTSLFNQSFHYLKADRIFAINRLELPNYYTGDNCPIGSQGEYTAHFLSLYGRQDISVKKLKHPSQELLCLINQVEAWMGEISPGTRINIKGSSDLDLVSLQYSYGLSNPYRATNVGFGISYTLPIIVAILASEPGTLILLENPEAHLHPKGQAKMGELLALAASCGIQIVVETHSDHILNGIRLAVHGGKIDPDDVQLHYFQRIEEARGEAKIEVISPRMDRNGRIDCWPDGFFDEWKKSLAKLIQPAESE